MSFPRYERYKESGVEWLGEVPEGWEVKRLRFVTQLNPSKSEIAKLDRGTEVSFLPMEAVGDDGSLILEKTRTLRDVENGYTYFREGDVTVAKITPCFENGKGAVMRGLLSGIGFGTTELNLASISSTNIMELPVVLPPTKEQSAIVSFLDSETAKIDALVGEAQQAIGLLKERRSALISAAVTGKIRVSDL